MTGFDEFESDVFENLPQDAEQAFLLLEGKYRAECEKKAEKAHPESNFNVFYVDYIAQVIATITELGLQAEFADRVPRIEDVDYNTYQNFSKDVKHYRTMLLIRHGRRVQGYSVRFDTTTKVKVQHHIQQLRDIFDKLEVDRKKKEALMDKLNDLQSEIDRERTRYDALAALAVETAGVIGETIEKSKVLKILDGIAKVMWNSKAEEETKRLTAPTVQKRIPPPPRSSEPHNKKSGLDDEIPF